MQHALFSEMAFCVVIAPKSMIYRNLWRTKDPYKIFVTQFGRSNEARCSIIWYSLCFPLVWRHPMDSFKACRNTSIWSMDSCAWLRRPFVCLSCRCTCQLGLRSIRFYRKHWLHYEREARFPFIRVYLHIQVNEKRRRKKYWNEEEEDEQQIEAGHKLRRNITHILLIKKESTDFAIHK